MFIKFENFAVQSFECEDGHISFMVTCQDREQVSYDEKWVVAHLTKDEMQKVYESLKQYFE